jgi:hypothetical protein
MSRIRSFETRFLKLIKIRDIKVLDVIAEPQINKSLCSTMGCGVVSLGYSPHACLVKFASDANF